MSLLPARVLISGLLLGLVAAVPTLPTARAQTGDPEYQLPKVGKCRNSSNGDAFSASDPTTPTACSERHTLKTYAVKVLPESVWSGGYTQYQIAIWKACGPGFSKALGRPWGTIRRSTYEMFFFTPTDDQRAQGASWVRCDVGLLKERGKLLPLPTSGPLLPASVPKRMSRCLYNLFNYYVAACPNRNDYKATDLLIKQGAYPGFDELHAMASKQCKARVSTPRNFQYQIPLEFAWKHMGDKVIVCYSKT